MKESTKERAVHPESLRNDKLHSDNACKPTRHQGLYRLIALMLALAAFWGWTGASRANAAFRVENTVTLRTEQPFYVLGRQLMYLEDPSGKKTLQDIIRESDGFVQGDKDVLNFGITASAYWLKIRVTNGADASTAWLLEHADNMYQYIDLWMVSSSGKVHTIKAGSMRVRDGALFDAHGNVFELNIPPNESVDIYLRGETGYVQQLPLTIWRLDAFHKSRANLGILHGVYIGVIIAMLMYNAFVYKSIQEPAYLYYVGYLGAMAIVQCLLNGLITYHILTDQPSLANLLFTVCYSVGSISSMLFTIHFMQLRGGERAVFNFLISLFFVTIFSGVVGGYRYWTETFQSFCMLGVIGALGIGSIHAFRGDKAAVYYVAGFGWFLIAAIVFVLTINGHLPFRSFSFYIVEMGGGIEAVLLSLAMAQRIKMMKEEKEKAQAAEVAAQKHTVEAQREAINSKQIALDTIQGYSIKLASEIKARTAELMETQQKLIASEKMAALGIFTAGMAHEINNPANFVAAGAQNAEYQVQKLQAFVGELLDDEAGADIQGEFKSYFTKIAAAHEVIKTGVKRIENVVKQLRSDNPEGDVGMRPADVVDSLESAWRILSPTVKAHVLLSTQLYPSENRRRLRRSSDRCQHV